MKDTSPSAGTPIDDVYRIATVSNLTGIPVQTMRSATNARLYRRADIKRLPLLKAAVDAGHAIGTVASLTERKVRVRFEFMPAGVAKTPERGCRVLVCGKALAARLAAAWQDQTGVRVQAIMAAPSAVGPDSPDEVGVVIVDAPVLEAILPGALWQLQAATRARDATVLYGFGNRQTPARLDDINVIARVTPADPAQLARIRLLGLLGLAVDPKAPDHFLHMLNHPAARCYDDMYLGQTPSSVQRECPNHVVDLLMQLNAFERYSLACESANATDASVHAMLYLASGHSREILEEALRHLLAHEGVPALQPLQQ